MNLRMIGLAVAVVFTAMLPLAAEAGPIGGTSPAEGAGEGQWPVSAAEPVDEAKPRSERKPVPRPGLGGAAAPSAPSPVTDATAPQTSALCGPELASPGGVEAQTCVLTEGRDTWARTYYRNATGGKLTSVLTLMGPGGRTMQTNCAVGAGDDPDACETPRMPSRGAVSAYSAVAEFATADGSGEGPLVLRSGSNSAAPAGH
ncbi:hypothetical protein ACQEVG_00110 [Streptomyces sp. CA-135486]|uniref:hypothetical protein n=1 Tax=Streptomyces sp. CA-135486 TaxID=3240049 RepID=UPI003D8DA66D